MILVPGNIFIPIIRDNDIEECGLEMYFTQDQENFGEIQAVELVPGGGDKLVTEENKQEYIK